MRASPRKRSVRAAGALFIVILAGCASDSATLNSEHIARKYGNYAIEVIETNEFIRVSNLYSESATGRICRTFAVVQLTRQREPSFASEHAQIVAGGSIGSVFKSRGWQIEKEHQYIGEIAIDSMSRRIVRLMRLDTPATASIHVYNFRISTGEVSFDYAMIAEVHHPDYLTAAMLRSIYGNSYSGPENRGIVGEMMEIVRLKLHDPMFGASSE